jgi:DNA (cytosine-5)-methyltransferase 1
MGGFDLAAEWMGWENKFHCEWNEFGQKVLKHYWPNAELFTDITKSDFKKYHGAIDIISGGFPCQPYSAAGKRLGKEDSRHLWPQMLRAIREIQPRWIVGENVLGLINWSDGLVFHEVQTDLEAEGYEVQPVVLAAAGVNAPHRRDRIWFVAYSKGAGVGQNIGGLRGVLNGCYQRKEDESLAADTNGNGFNQRYSKHEEQSSQRGVDAFGHIIKGDGDGDAADTDGIRGGKDERFGNGESNVVDEISEKRDATNTMRIGRKDALENEELERGRFRQSCERHTWDTFPSVSPICGRNDGIPGGLDGITFPKWRNESIKAYGNAVCPQVVHQIFKAIEQYEQLNTQQHDTNIPNTI